MTEDNSNGVFRPEFWADVYRVLPDAQLPSYVNAVTFMKLPRIESTHELVDRGIEVAIVGAPFDDAVSHRPGARFAPQMIRQATYVVGTDFPSIADNMIRPFEVLRVADAGDANIVPSWHTRGHAMIYQKCKEVLAANVFPVIIGGDHSVTWPAASAVAETIWPRKLGIIHFDAHADTVESNWGQPPELSGHGTPMRRLIQSGAVAPSAFRQIGLRGFWPSAEVFEWMRAEGLRWYDMDSIEDLGLNAVLDETFRSLAEQVDAVYCSVDIDVVEPASAPGTGAPEPGGLHPRELLSAVRRVIKSCPVVAMDIVEVAPAYDVADVTSTLANRLIVHGISALAAKKAGTSGGSLVASWPGVDSK